MKARVHWGIGIVHLVLGLLMALAVGQLVRAGQLVHAANAVLAVVELRPASIVAGPDILLGEIANITVPNGDTDVVVRLHNLTVGRAALPGENRTLYAGSIRVRLRQVGFSDAAVQLISEPQMLQVHTAATIVPGQELLASAQTLLYATLGDTATISCPLLPEATIIPGEAAAYEIQLADAAQTWAAGSTSLLFEIWSGKAVQKRLNVRCTVNATVEVAVLAKSMDKHAQLAANAVVWEQRDLASINGTPLSRAEAEELAALRLLRPLSAGTVLTKENTEYIPLAAAGELVRLVFATGMVKVEDVGRLQHDAWLGRQVAVVNVRTGKLLHGTLVAKDTVAID